jgi:hypothetical protein
MCPAVAVYHASGSALKNCSAGRRRSRTLRRRPAVRQPGIQRDEHQADHIADSELLTEQADAQEQGDEANDKPGEPLAVRDLGLDQPQRERQ